MSAVAEEPRMVKSAQRALVVLEVLADAKGAIPVTELHRRTGFPRSSLHQLLHTMIAMQWVEPSADGTSVRLAGRALLVGTSYLDADLALPYAVHTLEEIREATGYTVHYARLDGSHVLYLATRETTEPHRATSRVGRRLPAYATALGKALLAELTSAEADALLPPGPLTALTERTITDRDALARELEETRKRGYSVEHEQNTRGIGCVSVTVPYRIPATDAISCSMPLADAENTRATDKVATVLQEHAQRLATRLRAEGIR
jgi:IclR family transcriptional regulator, acetate operon repressor